ncbi:ankyrin and het domain-containing protein [Colletotrichum chrysophilum]|uniref:Ankyrin and het domain-containing protein n=1 Tax=Colletotrichum chrysophilum TaxID=1836956 RepID=A0AAD9EDX4_9PEZI|nr:ankyrin and het domain-containing protein [Colletotrichum chrysophilum]
MSQRAAAIFANFKHRTTQLHRHTQTKSDSRSELYAELGNISKLRGCITTFGRNQETAYSSAVKPTTFPVTILYPTVVASVVRAASVRYRARGKREARQPSAASDEVGGTMTEYQYEPLSPDSIRLLVLQPSAYDTELRGSLLCTTLAEADYDLIDPYTALSYVWGSDERPCLIFLDGKDFAITQSLHDALRDMRDATRVLRIWADALCINQGDVPERNVQVKLMGKIYGAASNTILYLGHLTEDAAEVLAATTWRAAEVDYDSDGQNTGGTHVAEVSNKHTLVEVACRRILSRPWFQRVWVLQELVLSKSPWIQCGHQRVRWKDFCRFLFCKATNPPNKYGALLSVLGNMNETRNLRAGGVGMPLWDVLKLRRGFGAADPRDRVYANFGIINDLRQVRRYLNVDYGVSLQVMFSKLAEYIISAKGATYLMTTHTGYGVDIVASVSAVLPIDRQAANALVATEKYVHVRKMLSEFYNDVVKTTKPVKPADLQRALEDYFLILRLDSLAIEEKESQHKSLCESLGLEWVRFFEALDEQSNAESSAGEDFSALFSLWVRREARKQRPFLGVRDTFGRTEQSDCFNVPYLLQRYLESDTDDHLPGRRLAITDSGECALVPEHVREGDVIIALTDPTHLHGRPWPLLIVREKEEERSQEMDATIMEAIHKHKTQPNEVPTDIYDPNQWRALLARDADCRTTTTEDNNNNRGQQQQQRTTTTTEDNNNNNRGQQQQQRTTTTDDDDNSDNRTSSQEKHLR